MEGYYFMILKIMIISIYKIKKTFQKLLDIDIYEPIKEYETKSKENAITVNNYEREIKISIKELYNSIILISYYNYLIELNLHGKTYDIKVVKDLDDNILEINELSDKRIITFLRYKIIVLSKKDNEEYINIEKYKIKDNWKIPIEGYNEAYQYFLSDKLPNNRLLIHSFKIGTKFVHGNIFHRYILKEFANSKIIFIETKKF